MPLSVPQPASPDAPPYAEDVGIARHHPGFGNPEPRPEELKDFQGMWVAVKAGHVVAAAATSRALVYEVHKLGDRGKGVVAQYVPEPQHSSVVGVG